MMLDVQGLRTGYGRIPILNGVGFSVSEREFVGVLGHKPVFLPSTIHPCGGHTLAGAASACNLAMVKL